jgi:hypothetical protein
MKSSEICDAAATLINERGWARGSYEDPDGRLCIMGALRRAMHDNDATIEDVIRARIAVHYRLPKYAPDVVIWNDQFARTQEEVTTIFRAAAQDLREGTPP